MCHLRSLGRVANFKNEACGNGGIGFDFFEFLTCCTCCRMIIRGGWGWGVERCINVLDEHFLYVTEDAHVAHAVVWSSGGVGVGGRGGVLTSLTSTSLTLRKMQTLHRLSVVSKIIPTKGSSWPKSTTNNISLLKTKTYHFRCRLWDKSYRTICCWYSTNGWNMETLGKMATSVDAPQKKNVHKKRYTWAYSWTWRHSAALLQTVASTLPQALWHR